MDDLINAPQTLVKPQTKRSEVNLNGVSRWNVAPLSVACSTVTQSNEITLWINSSAPPSYFLPTIIFLVVHWSATGLSTRTVPAMCSCGRNVKFYKKGCQPYIPQRHFYPGNIHCGNEQRIHCVCAPCTQRASLSFLISSTTCSPIMAAWLETAPYKMVVPCCPHDGSPRLNSCLDCVSPSKNSKDDTAWEASPWWRIWMPLHLQYLTSLAPVLKRQVSWIVIKSFKSILLVLHTSIKLITQRPYAGWLQYVLHIYNLGNNGKQRDQSNNAKSYRLWHWICTHAARASTGRSQQRICDRHAAYCSLCNKSEVYCAC